MEIDRRSIIDYGFRTLALMKELEREILLSFWKVHILHHAETQPVFGQWVTRELRRHGYEVSPGTLYPLLTRMQERGWLRLTRRRVLAVLREQVEELYREVVLGEEQEDRG